MNETNCARYEALCSAAIDHALTKEEQKELDAHLAECPACRAYLEDLRAMRALWKELETPMPQALHEKIMGEIEAEVQKTIVQTPQKHRRRPPVFTMLAAAAACVMLAVSGHLTGLFGRIGADEIQPSVVNAYAQTGAGPATAEAGPETALPEDVPALDSRAVPDAQLAPAADTPAQEQDQPESDEAPDAAAEQPGQEETAPEQSAPQDSHTASDKSGENSADTAQAAPFAAQPRVAMAQAPSVPDAVARMSFARCYVVSPADGSETDGLPVIKGMTLIIEDEGAAYYSAENNESKVGKVQQELEKNGYTVTLDQSSGVTTQRDAKQILFIVPKA